MMDALDRQVEKSTGESPMPERGEGGLAMPLKVLARIIRMW